MAKKIKVLDNVSGVEQIINVSSLASNGTITGSDLMLIEQSNTLKKVSITDLSAEFGGGGFALPVDETYSGGADNSFAFKLTGDNSISGQTVIGISLPAGEFENNNVGLQLYNQSGDGTLHPLIIKRAEPINNINQANDTNNIFSLTKNDKAVFGGVYKAGNKALIENGISIDLINNSIRLYNPSDDTEYKDINYQRDSGTGNYHVLKVEFEANADYETTTVLPVGSQIDRLVIDRGAGLTTGTSPLTFSINGSTPVTLATQGSEFDNDPGIHQQNYFCH